MMGVKEREAANILISELKLPMTTDEYLAERNAGHADKFPHCKPMPGVMRLVLHLKENGIPIVVATSSHRKAFELKASNNQALFSQFEGNIVCGDDVRVVNSKPAPDIFLAAASDIKSANPETCLVFEDAPSGVKAGLNAGMNVVWIPDPNLAIDHELASRCVEVLKSMDEFNPIKYGLPPFPL